VSICDTDLHLRADWENHVGINIGGTQPTSYGTVLLPNARQFFTAGKAYSDWLAAIHRPICPNTGYLTLSFELMTDAACYDQAQALEFDTRISIASLNYNLSSQFNYFEGGAFQITDVRGNWIDSGWKPGKFVPYVWYPITLRYGFDVAKKAYSFLSANNGVGSPYVIPKVLQGLPAQPLAWADSCSLQVQLDLAAAGGAFSIFTRKMEYTWE
jgi:hypothetical protein